MRDAFYSPIATTNAIAWVSVWLKLSDQVVNPNSSASRLPFPCKTRYGAFLSSARTSISSQPTSPMPQPNALAAASLAANRPASEGMRPAHSRCSASVNTRTRKRPPCRPMASSMRTMSIKSTPVRRIICSDHGPAVAITRRSGSMYFRATSRISARVTLRTMPS